MTSAYPEEDTVLDSDSELQVSESLEAQQKREGRNVLIYLSYWSRKRYHLNFRLYTTYVHQAISSSIPSTEPCASCTLYNSLAMDGAAARGRASLL